LEGFVSGLQIARAARGLSGHQGATPVALPLGEAAAEPVGPDAAHLRAQNRVIEAGGKLSDQEKFKREQHPFDAYERLKAQAAGIDPQELLDTRAYAREWHFHILNERALYGIPRKFNVAFDGAGTIPVLEDTNDIGFQAVTVKDGFGVEPGVWFRVTVGGIT